MTEKKAQGFIDIWNMASNHQDDYWPQEVAELLTRGWEVYTVDEVRVEHEADPCQPSPVDGWRGALLVEPGSSHQSGERAAHTRPGDRRPPAQDPPREPTPDPNREPYSPSSE